MQKIFLVLILLFSYSNAINLTISGTVISDTQQIISSHYMGYIKKINVNIGDKVKRDDILFEIESGEFDIMKSQAEMGLDQAKIFLNMYQSHLRNIKKENNTSMQNIKKEEIENLDISTENTIAMIKAAKQVIKQMTNKVKQFTGLYNYLKVKAPNDGVIIKKRVNIGDRLMPGVLAMVLVDINDLKIEASVPEANLKYIKIDQKVKIKIPSIDFSTTGVVQAIVPSTNPMTHTMTLRVSFNKKDREIFPGMYAKIIISN